MKALAMIYSSMIEHFLKTRTLRNLNKLTDSQLDDIGISRELLVKGVSAYPWQVEEVGLQQPTVDAVLLQFKQPAANEDYHFTRAA